MRNLIIAAVVGSAVLLTGCQINQPKLVEPQPVAPVRAADPVATHLFQIKDDQDVIGQIQVTKAGADDTLSDIARRFNLGYEELVRANPGVDPWVPGEGRDIVLPTQFVLPKVQQREGLVVNLAALRVFYFPKRKSGEPQMVVTHPIGIGKVGWNTPLGETKVVSKRKNPTWVPPASVRKEHAERGDILPKVVPAGDENPLGAFAMNLGWSGYLIHGTNKPYGVGMRSSHGCMRFYPEDIALLFEEIPIGTKVQVVNQRFVSGWRDGRWYVQVMPPSEEELEQQQKPKAKQKPVVLLGEAERARLIQQAGNRGVQVNTALLDEQLSQQTGIALPVSSAQSRTEYLQTVRHVENRVPEGATWDGNKQLLVTAEEFEAMRKGEITPKKEETKPAPAKPQSSAISTPAAPATAQKISFVTAPVASTLL